MDYEKIADEIDEIAGRYKSRVGFDLAPYPALVMVAALAKDDDEIYDAMEKAAATREISKEVSDIMDKYNTPLSEYEVQSLDSMEKHLGDLADLQVLQKREKEDPDGTSKQIMIAAIKAGCDTEFPWDEYTEDLKKAFRG